MSILRNKNFAGKELITAFGKILFNEKGEANVELVVAEKLATLRGFEVVDSKPIGEEVIGDKSEEIIENNIEKADLEALNKMNVPQLRKYAKDHGIDLEDATKKDEIIAIILA